MIEATRWHLLTGQNEQRNTLAGPISNSATNLTFTYDLRGIREGAMLSVGLELMLVMEATDSANTATVMRGINGSTAASHLQGDVVTVNPRFPDFAVLRELNNDLRALSAMGLYQVGTFDRTFDGTVRAFDLGADVLDILEVRYQSSGGTERWPLVDRWSVMSDMPTADFPSGRALRVDSRIESYQPLRIRYKKAFGLLTNLTDDVQTVTGLWSEAHDIPPLGAAVRLGAARDIRRTDTQAQGDTKRPNEVPAGTPQGAVRTLAAERQVRIAQEQGRLYSRYPMRRALA